eukprot:5517722-Prymnesium_polylepis.1
MIRPAAARGSHGGTMRSAIIAGEPRGSNMSSRRNSSSRCSRCRTFSSIVAPGTCGAPPTITRAGWPPQCVSTQRNTRRSEVRVPATAASVAWCSAGSSLGMCVTGPGPDTVRPRNSYSQSTGFDVFSHRTTT